MTVRGRWRSAAQVIGLVLRAPGDWLEVTETLSADEGTLAAREAFESRWELRGGDEVREVFSPSLVPEEGDLVGRHMMRAPVLVAESAAIGAALVVDIDLLEKSGALPAALGLVRMPGGGADLVVGLHAQEVRGHVAHRRRPASGDLGAQTISHRYYLGLFSQPRPGQALAAARRKIRSAARAEHRAGPWPRRGGSTPGRFTRPPSSACGRAPSWADGAWAPSPPTARTPATSGSRRGSTPCAARTACTTTAPPWAGTNGWKWPGTPGPWCCRRPCTPWSRTVPAVCSPPCSCSARTDGSRATTKAEGRAFST